MRLLDSNIIIYATDPENEWLRIWLEAEPFAISQISQIEVLGYHQITPEEITDLQEFLYSSNVLPVSDEAANKAIALRQQRFHSLSRQAPRVGHNLLVRLCRFAVGRLLCHDTLSRYSCPGFPLTYH